MEAIIKVAREMEMLIAEVPAKMSQLPKELVDHKHAPDKWSKKEILGHLCDSAFNNLQRLIRVQYEEKPYSTYNQDEWVKNQHYQELAVDHVIQLWVALHQQLVHVIKSFPEAYLESLIDVGNEVTAGFVITDYLDHQRHHLKQIFGN